ncbi:MAG: bifunctional phosphoserine phosphatase/homoserine phosphotransferase ThrH [Candidatus Hodarchaeota archaeon]
MFIVCLDLEGVLTPEIWEEIAKTTEINELMLTTRDIPDYDVLMKRRLKILKDNHITLFDIKKIISNIELLPGALEFIEWLKSVTQLVIITGSFSEFTKPLMKKLGYPLVLCHNLEIDNTGIIINYKLRITDMKKKTVLAFKEMNYDVIAVGDSYNDIDMLKEAKYGILFRPPMNIKREFSEFPSVKDYSELKFLISTHIGLKNH